MGLSYVSYPDLLQDVNCQALDSHELPHAALQIGGEWQLTFAGLETMARNMMRERTRQQNRLYATAANAITAA